MKDDTQLVIEIVGRRGVAWLLRACATALDVETDLDSYKDDKDDKDDAEIREGIANDIRELALEASEVCT